MPKRLLIRKGAYFDSIFLMRAARRMANEPGVRDASAIMGTEANRTLLAGIGYDADELSAAGANDLVIAVEGDEAAIAALLTNPDRWLHRQAAASETACLDIGEALTRRPDAALAVISVPGEYAAAEARKALARNLNVFLFSSNVSVEDELSLKRDAREKGLIVMGPDCGTALIGGAGIGFANAVRRGPIGVVGATGTGMQELTCLIHQAGSGISHAIGAGSRDLSDRIGGLSTLTALEALETDDKTNAIVLLSKPPGVDTMRGLAERLEASRKPIIACLLGADPTRLNLPGSAGPHHFRLVSTIDQAASLALETIGKAAPAFLQPDIKKIRSTAAAAVSQMAAAQRYLRGIFAGGTFCYQSQSIMRDGGLSVYSNAPLDGMRDLENPAQSKEHSLVDMGAETFVAGRLHPMIDATLRRERILRESADPEVGVLLLDFILGAIASADPAGDLVGAIGTAKEQARRRGGHLCVAASVCGTEDDEQRLNEQVKSLQAAGILVFASNAQAALFGRELALRMQSR